MMKNNQIVGLIVVVIAIVGAIAYLEAGKAGPGSISNAQAADVALPDAATATSSMSASTTTSEMTSGATLNAEERIAQKSLVYDRAKEIVDPSGFVNTDGKPITLSQYVGKKVILLDIMTYSCINCIRTFPYLVDWYKKYEDKGLVIIGIHTPEFDFEKNIDNVRAAMAKYGITFPVVLDNDYGTWSAYKNLYWPRKYLIDIDGFVRYDHIGEGGYDETEAKIQELLKERADVLGLGDAYKAKIAMPDSTGAVEAGMPGESLETYFGSARNQFFGNPTAAVPAGQSGQGTFTAPSDVALGRFYFDGTWSVLSDHAENVSVPAKIVYRFAAKHVYLVASADAPTVVRVTVDGKPLGTNEGADVGEKNGVDTFTVHESRLYDLYSGDSFGEHTIELAPQSAGLKAFTLTFGS